VTNYPVTMPGGETQYRRLEADKVHKTIDQLHQRISESLPGRNLPNVAVEIGDVVRHISGRSARNRRTDELVRVGCRAGIALVTLLTAFAVAFAVRETLSTTDAIRAVDWVQFLESGIQDLVFAGIAIFFLSSIPNRLNRRESLASLHRLRSLAHIIDMHQMSKDPEDLLPARASGRRADAAFTPAEFGRYLDYCSELLSMVSKAAALCADESTDAVILDTVSEIENLTNGMSRKIWQKITLLQLPGRAPV